MNWYLRRVSLNAVSVTSNYQLPNLEAALTRRRAGRFLPVPSPLYPAQGRHRDVSCLEFSNFDIIWIHIVLVESAFWGSSALTFKNLSMKTLLYKCESLNIFVCKVLVGALN